MLSQIVPKSMFFYSSGKKKNYKNYIKGKKDILFYLKL